MTEEIQIRLVHVEFLRPGPPHNQLLSPLTQYLAIAGDTGAGVVTLPYEQAEFWRRLKQLRYETGDVEDRQAMLHSTGVEMGRILGSVPGLPGALTMDPNRQGTLIQLRITLSASELAMLPFELAKAPVSATTTAENWLSIQSRPPVCVTRNIRTVSPEGVVWPNKPRILFVSGDPANVPYKDHRAALLKAIEPFRYPADPDDPRREPHEKDARQQYDDLLTILVNPTLTDVFRECKKAEYTHVHVLTHGDLSETSPDSYGLVLRGDNDSTDVVSGEQFATALTFVGTGRIHRPTVVTVASCDSGNVGTVVLPGASFAHALHQAGIPLVVASQFPLSKPGSVPMAQAFYDGLLWGQHPLVLLQQLRAELHVRYTSTFHDWASLVVYEALPQALPEQLETLRYFQTKRAINAVLERIDQKVRKFMEKRPDDVNAALRELDCEIEAAVGRLPLTGQYAAECLGIRASSRKRLAQAAFTLCGVEEAPPVVQEWHDPYELLDEAYLDYSHASRALLVSEGAAQRVATLHWILVQLESLALILGRNHDEGRWTAARLSAEMYLDHRTSEERAWAHGSLAELCLIRLGQTADEDEREKLRKRAVEHAKELARLYPRRVEFPVKSTRRQFMRYADWWSSTRFEHELTSRGLSRPQPWNAKHGVVEVAAELIKILHGNERPQLPCGEVAKGGNGNGGSNSDPDPDPETPPNGGETLKRGAATKSRSDRKAKFFDVAMLPAGHGDSLWIEYGDGDGNTHRCLIDCGTQRTAKELVRRVTELPTRERYLELFILSHIDADHIGGALPFLKAVREGLRFGDIWYNGWRHVFAQLGARQGEMFSSAILDLELPWNLWQDGNAIVLADNAPLPTHTLPGGMKLTLLSPTPEQLRKLGPVWTRELKKHGLTPGARVDYSRFLRGKPSTSTNVDELADTVFSSDPAAPNGSSIAVLAEYEGASALFAADAHAPVLQKSIEKLLAERKEPRLKIDAFKVSHHASQNNVSKELLALLDCPRFLISTNGDHFYHPDREAIARIIKYGRQESGKPELIFNYRTPYTEVWEPLQDRHAFTARYPDTRDAGQVVSLL